MMRSIRASICVAICLVGILNAAFAKRLAFGIRQDTRDIRSVTQSSVIAASIPVTTARQDEASTSQAIATSAVSFSITGPDLASVPSDTHTSARVSVTSTSRSNLSATAVPSISSSTSLALHPTPNGTSTNQGQSLPIQPRITPALGIAGAILILAGAAYTLVGIKNKWLYIFISAGFLSSLAVAVLVVYLENPPVSNAVQGAYFVAACITGIIAGGLSLVFPDVTDGLGCLLGGFCLSMWLLVLRPGGLIQSKTGKAIFIAIFCAVTFSLSFSRYTRTYGLIGSTAFSGATAVVLGIDWFSRAGLKEFWLYIWNLNDNLFPLNTLTYPITRGLRVEIASIVLICLFGIISQMRLWKIIKERREGSVAAQIQAEVDVEKMDTERSKKLEEEISRDRNEWEAQYGNTDSRPQHHVDSGFVSSKSSTRKVSISSRPISLFGVDTIGTTQPERLRKTSEAGLTFKTVDKKLGRPVLTVSPVLDDSIKRIDADGDMLTDTTGPLPLKRLSQVSGHRFSIRNSNEIKSVQSGRGSTQPSARNSLQFFPSPPLIVPLPFKVPCIDDEHEDDDWGRSITSALSGQASKVNGQTEAFSDVVTSKDISGPPNSLYIPYKDDRRSSIAATLNDLIDDNISLPRLSFAASPIGESFPEDSRMLPAMLPRPSSSEYSEGSEHIAKVPQSMDSKDQAAEAGSEATMDHSGNEGSANTKRVHNSRPDEVLYLLTEQVDVEVQEADHGTSQLSADQGASHPQPMPAALKRAHLPAPLPKVATTYRTNEWAKHLEVADRPALDELGKPSSPGIIVEHRFAEVAAPPPINELHQFPARADSNPDTRNSAQVSVMEHQKKPEPARSSSHVSIASMQPRTSLSTSTSNRPLPLSTGHGMRRSQSQMSVNTSTSAPLAVSQKRPGTFVRRSMSSPLLDQLVVESPVEEVSEDATMLGPQSLVMRNTLLTKRTDMMRNKLRTTSFMQNHAPIKNASTPNLALITASDSASAKTLALNSEGVKAISPSIVKQTMIDHDDMTLARRKQLLSQHQAPIREETWPPPQQHRQQQPHLDTHQPKRSSTVDHGNREVMMASWRDSIRENFARSQPRVTEEGRRQAMMSDRRQAQTLQQQQQLAASHRDSMFDAMMRRGDMMDLHKAAMRRMQAGANRNP